MSQVDFANSYRATYSAIQLPRGNDPVHGGFVDVEEGIPGYHHLSPQGWHFMDPRNVSHPLTTSGNNAQVRKRQRTLLHAHADHERTFKHDFSPSALPSHEGNIKAALTNTFYVINWLHDLSYAYGFTEEAGNFQQSNFGRGGKDRGVIP